MHRDAATMTTSDIEWMQEHFNECERIGQGIGTNEGLRVGRLQSELEARGFAE